MSAAAPVGSPPPAKLRTVLDYVPCDACLAEHSVEQELLCSVCRRLDRTVVAKRIEHRRFIVVRPAPPPPPDVIPPAPPVVEAPAPPAPVLPPVVVLDAESTAASGDLAPGTVEVVVARFEDPLLTPPPVPVEVAEPQDDLDVSFAVEGDDAGFGVADEEPGGFDFTPPPPPEPAPEPAAPAPTFDEKDFVFNPPPPEEPPAREEPPAEPAEAAREDDAPRNPWSRPVEDDWLLESPPPRETPPEERWPEERPAPEPAPERAPEPTPEPAAAEEIVEASEVLEEPPSEWARPAEPEPEPAPAADEVVESTVVEDAAEAASLADLPDVRAADLDRLAEAGVHEASDLVGRDPWQLADATNLSARRLERWIWAAELMTVAKVPPREADALVRSGVRGLDGLRAVDPARAAREAGALPGGAGVTAERVAEWKRRA